MLAAVHRSMDVDNRRESERREWWQPRAESVSKYIAKEMCSSDIVLLQEWWFNKEFEDIFDHHTKHIFDRLSERRPGGQQKHQNGTEMKEREDGMAVLVNKNGKLKLLQSRKVLTGPQRIAQIVHCEERDPIDTENKIEKRHVFFANTHLSFPGGADDNKNARKQTFEIMIAARALEKDACTYFQSNLNSSNMDSKSQDTKALLQIVGGDFNSNSCGMAATKLIDKFGFVNCASATAEQTLCSGSGGRVNLGVTHRTHRGEDVSVDHIFARLVCSNDQNSRKNKGTKKLGDGTILSTPSNSDHLRNLGYLPFGVQILNTRQEYLNLDGKSIISDHRPVTAELKWPGRGESDELIPNYEDLSLDDFPLDPLQPPWPTSYEELG